MLLALLTSCEGMFQPGGDSDSDTDSDKPVPALRLQKVPSRAFSPSTAAEARSFFLKETCSIKHPLIPGASQRISGTMLAAHVRKMSP